MRTKYKIVFLGEQNVGKSTLISQFVYKCIEDKYQPTIGIDFLPKRMEIDGKEVKLQIWDTAGQEKFNSIISSYARDSFIAVIVYDLSKRKSFDSVDRCINDLVKIHDPENKIKILLVGNKTDLIEEKKDLDVLIKEGEEKAKQFNATFLQTCAKTYEGILCIEDYFVKTISEDINNEYENNDTLLLENEHKSRCC
ncbi:GTP-binding ryh1-like [Tubulinosema ratisbonensis]|uniref:GTP-binding ryh1-like n=1 Tax=Tubulinosema ratisbonensis TaxID=291195 RepID=A0A437AN12_9MICR|nr:GTP-binding ryh1-like [Tubulinosema ratisbonensis]